jgi:hypothetical protein
MIQNIEVPKADTMPLAAGHKVAGGKNSMSMVFKTSH